MLHQCVQRPTEGTLQPAAPGLPRGITLSRAGASVEGRGLCWVVIWLGVIKARLTEFTVKEQKPESGLPSTWLPLSVREKSGGWGHRSQTVRGNGGPSRGEGWGRTRVSGQSP